MDQNSPNQNTSATNSSVPSLTNNDVVVESPTVLPTQLQQSQAPSGKEVEPHSALPIPESMVNTMQVSEANQLAKEEKDDYWLEYGGEIAAEKEAKASGGIEAIQTGEVNIPQDLAEVMGIQTVPTKIDLSQPTTKDFKVGGVTLNDQQLTDDIHQPEENALRWLAEWFIYQLKKAHYGVKIVKGKVFSYPPGEHPVAPIKPQSKFPKLKLPPIPFLFR